MPRENTARKGAEDAARKTLRAVAGGKHVMDEAQFDNVIHERTRLAIVSTLAVNPVLSFAELKKLLNLTDGNLSVHTQKLEAAGYVDCKKGFSGRVPRTEYRLTKKGRRVLGDYLCHMEALIQAVRDP
jgi:DNA-binding MarR family transcriptional regulator